MRTIHRDIVGVFIFSSDDHILLGKGGVYEGAWLIPGGGIEEGETKLEAIKRETLEETGIDISDFKVKLLDLELTGESEKVLRNSGEKVLVKMKFYNFTAYANRAAKDIVIVPADDMKEASWHPVKDLPNLNLSPPSKTTLHSLGYL